MKELRKVVEGLDYKLVKGNLDVNVEGVHIHSAQIRRNYAFIAVKGERYDGLNFVSEALRNGASCVIVEEGRGVGVSEDTTVVEVRNLRDNVPSLFINFEGDNISSDVLVCGVTGTNGKTTVAFLIHRIWEEAGIKSILISSIGTYIMEERYKAGLTTPDVPDLFYSIKEGKNRGCRNVIMEVTSIGLDKRRCDWLHFNVGIFTNISRDHLDYHNTMDEYVKAKARFFKEILSHSNKEDKFAVINVDDPCFRCMLPEGDVEVVKYSLKSPFADVWCERYHYSEKGIEFEISAVGKRLRGRTSLKGTYNVYNILSAISFAVKMNIDERVILRGIESFQGVPGRLEEIKSQKGSIYIDYAHTPEALEKVLKALRLITPGRLITVFGCGGDRDKGKRPEMGKIASSLSDVVILTSDNPRSEDPTTIINDILTGVKGKEFDGDTGYLVEVNRRDAIRKGIEVMSEGDTLLIAGKGHEDYQVIGEKVIPFSDRDEVYRVLKDVEGE